MSCKIENDGRSIEVGPGLGGKVALLAASRRLGGMMTMAVSPDEARRLAGALIAAASRADGIATAPLDPVAWLRLLAASDHAAAIRGLPDALETIASRVESGGRDAAWIAKNVANSTALEALFELWDLLGVTSKEDAAAMLRATIHAERRSTEWLEEIWGRLGVSGQIEAFERISDLRKTDDTQAKALDAILGTLQTTSIVEAIERVERLVGLARFARWACFPAAVVCDFEWLAPTAQSGGMTEGQKIVAAWETDTIAAPAELAAAIDKALADAREQGRAAGVASISEGE